MWHLHRKVAPPAGGQKQKPSPPPIKRAPFVNLKVLVKSSEALGSIQFFVNCKTDDRVVLLLTETVQKLSRESTTDIRVNMSDLQISYAGKILNDRIRLGSAFEYTLKAESTPKGQPPTLQVFVTLKATAKDILNGQSASSPVTQQIETNTSSSTSPLSSPFSVSMPSGLSSPFAASTSSFAASLSSPFAASMNSFRSSGESTDIKSGFMMKKDHMARRQKWRKRWFVLSEDNLSYYDKKTYQEGDAAFSSYSSSWICCRNDR